MNAEDQDFLKKVREISGDAELDITQPTLVDDFMNKCGYTNQEAIEAASRVREEDQIYIH